MEENKNNYSLYTEKIKESPLRKYKMLFDILRIVVCAAIFGVVAAVIFIVVVNSAGILEKDEPSRPTATISLDDYPGTNIEIPTEPSEIESVEAVNTQNDPDGTVESTMDASNNPTVETANSNLGITEYICNIADMVNPSMVTVTAIAQNQDPLLMMVERQTNLPGIIIADNNQEYLILTSSDIADANSLRVTFANGVVISGTQVQSDTVTKLAIVAVPHLDEEFLLDHRVKVAKLGNSYRVRQGETVIALGNWNGVNAMMDYGIISKVSEAVYETDSRHSILYTNMRGSKDSVGFLINEQGELVGCISGEYSKDNLVAYGISDLKLRLQNMSNQKAIGYLGIIGQEITDKMSKQYMVPIGVYVSKIETYSPAFASGVQYGDIIVDINGNVVTTLYSIERLMCELEPGTEVEITVNRLGKNGYVPVQYKVTLGTK